jgi:hypothetical protein
MPDSVTLPGVGTKVTTDLQPDGSHIQRLNLNDMDFVSRVLFRALSKLTFSMTGLRVDMSGQNITTVTTVTTVANANNTAVGNLNANGTGILLTRGAFQAGFRKNIVIA